MGSIDVSKLEKASSHACLAVLGRRFFSEEYAFFRGSALCMPSSVFRRRTMFRVYCELENSRRLICAIGKLSVQPIICSHFHCAPLIDIFRMLSREMRFQPLCQLKSCQKRAIAL